MIITLIYTISMDDLPFRKDLFPLLKFPKESNWISATLWVILLVCFVWQVAESRMANVVCEYLSSRKMAIKAIHKSFRDLKATSSSLNSATVSILREVEGVTLTSLESLLSYISRTKVQSKSSGWSLVSKLMNSKHLACEEEATEVNEFEKVDTTLFCLIRNKSRKLSNTNAETRKICWGNWIHVLKTLKDLNVFYGV